MVIKSGKRSAFGNSHPDESRTGSRMSESCDRYLFDAQVRHDFNISGEFLRALAKLKFLADAGVKIYFTWPAVVDSGISRCYDNASLMTQVDDYAGRIRSLVEEAGYAFIGSLRDSHFPSGCFVNTHYHITEDCGRVRSRRLVAQLAAAGAMPINSDETPGQLLDIAGARLEQVARALVERTEKFLPPVMEVETAAIGTKLLPSLGWSAPEEWGVWSLGPRSTLSLKVPPAVLQAGSIALHIRG